MNQVIKPGPSHYRRSVLLGLLALCFLVRLATFSGSKNFAYDAVVRTEIALAWSDEPFFIPSPQLRFPPQYSPLPIYLYGLGLKLIHNPQFTPRLISLLFGTLTLIPFFFLMEILYSQRSAVISSLFFCAYTLSIKSAVVASSESIFCFFLLMAIWRLYVYKNSRGMPDMYLAVVFMNLAAMSRYNGWLYIPLLTILIPDKLLIPSREEILAMLRFCLGSLILPVIWMVGCQKVYGDFLYPIRFILADHLRVIARTGPAWGSWSYKTYLLFFWPGVLFLTLTPPVAVLAVMGLKRAGKLRWGRHALVLSVVPLAFIFARVLIQGTFFPMARFLTDGGFFLLGYAALGYERMENQKTYLPAVVGVLVVLSVLALVAVGLSDIPKVSSKVRSLSPLARLEPTQQRISSYLKEHMTDDDKAVLDSYRGWSQVEIMFYSSHPRSQFLFHWRRKSQLVGWIRQNRPRYLITGPGGRAWDLVENKRLWSKTGFKPVLLHEAGKQNIYRLEKIS